MKVIQECLDHSLGLLEAIESGNERLLIEKCDSLQVSPLAWSKKVPAIQGPVYLEKTCPG